MSSKINCVLYLQDGEQVPLSEQVPGHNENSEVGGEILSVLSAWMAKEDGRGGGLDCVLLKKGGGGWWGQCIQTALSKHLSCFCNCTTDLVPKIIIFKDFNNV